jgi:hypothetical protein
MAQVRVINAIPDAASALDIDFNGAKAIAGLPFDTVSPAPATPAAYIGLRSGASTIEAFLTGQTTNPVLNSTTANLTTGSDYTVLLAGFAITPAAYLISDTNKAPAAGTVEIRVINGSASSSQQYPGGFDIYFLPQGQSISGNPKISRLTLGQAGPGYVTLPFLSQYVVWVTPHNNTTALISSPYPQSNPQITTLVIVDQPGGVGFSPTLLSLIDLQ